VYRSLVLVLGNDVLCVSTVFYANLDECIAIKIIANEGDLSEIEGKHYATMQCSTDSIENCQFLGKKIGHSLLLVRPVTGPLEDT
jgi:hypothetical protein